MNDYLMTYIDKNIFEIINNEDDHSTFSKYKTLKMIIVNNIIFFEYFIM